MNEKKITFYNRLDLLPLPLMEFSKFRFSAIFKEKRLLRILPLFLILLFVTACAGSGRSEEEKKLNYRNSRYSFSLVFPENWLNYTVFEKNDIVAPGFRIDTLYFALPTRSRGWNPVNVPQNFAEIFLIRIFDQDVWEDFYIKYGGNPSYHMRNDRIIFRGGGRVFVLRYSVALPADLYFYSRDVDEIISTFQYRGRR